MKLFSLLFFLLLWLPLLVCAEVRLSNNWASGYSSDGKQVPESQHEPERLAKASKEAAKSRIATAKPYDVDFTLGFRIHLDNVTYYIRGATFMAKKNPEEVCSPLLYASGKQYLCKEGQRYANECHLFFFDANFVEAGFHTVRIDQPYRHFCNAMPALGVYDKVRNELLVTVQYFPIDKELASKISDIGSGWSRMTVLFRVKAVEGKIVVEQDDRCLGNPNGVEDVPDARVVLKRCEAKPHTIK